MESRRDFLIKMLAGSIVMLQHDELMDIRPAKRSSHGTQCSLYRAINGSPAENMVKVIDLMGGIEKIVGSEDVVVIKPNVQWWNQGSPNLSALKTFVGLVMDRPGGFRGEVIVAENCHRGNSPWESLSSGWARTFAWNSDVQGVKNMNDLCAALKNSYGPRFSLVHWVDVCHSGRRVSSPADGDGYVYCDGTEGTQLLSTNNGIEGNDFRETIMTYPIFSSDRGTRIDFKNGIWKKGSYTDRPLRFITFSALNHHSTYCGITSTIKNYMGVTDLSGGPDPRNGGKLSGNFYNFHSFPFNNWAPGPEAGMLGKAIGTFMRTIRRADLNITTAKWIGLSSRVDLPAAHTRTVLACADPVALDYHAARYLLYPNSRLKVHDPDDVKGPFHSYLKNCAEECGGHLNEESVSVRSYDFAQQRFQKDDELIQFGETSWGSKFKPVMKYLYLRYFS